ncbi:MAG: hypothetical protein HS120_01920 [Burkholderiales bacterium]|nr:hypothetical protein [Burkholderiales bacterium]
MERSVAESPRSYSTRDAEVAGCRLRVAGCGLRVAGCGLRVAGCGLLKIPSLRILQG